ncbi:S8 family serine peptidase [Peterkaempfera bronchialis]|nr:S8 family serine peptidase [Peterkaempfera bronchialis]
MLPAAAATATVSPAPVLDGAGAGGPVIVWMKDQHANLNLRTQGAQRIAAAHSDQASIVSDIKSHGGTDIRQLVSVNAVAAQLSADEVKRLSRNSGVSKIVPDAQVEVLATATTATVDDPASLDPALCPSDPAKPLNEPEALADIHYQSDDPNAPRMASSIATGKGVLIGIDGMNSLAGNPNFTRTDGSHVVIGAPDYTKDKSNDEAYGDASSIGAQGTVVYDFAKELPYSGLPTGCTFVLRGDAPDASLVDAGNMDTPESIAGQSDSGTRSESQIVAGIDTAVTKYHVDVISESYGYSPRPGSYKTHWAANDAAVAAGVTVVVSSGDSGVSGTISSPADDPQVIAVGATNTLRLNAQAYGYTGWGNGDITPLSSGGVTPNNKVVDLVAPGYGGQAACNPAGSGCPTNTATEAFGGTSQSAPFVAGAAADVIQAYRDSHSGTSPTPAMVKQILTGTATDIGAPADQQGSGLLDIYAAVKAAQQMPGSTLATGGGDSPALVTPQTQLDLTGNPGTTNDQTVQLYNTGDTATTVTGSYRSLGTPTQIGDVVTEDVSAPDPSLPVPAEGARAAAPVTFTVPAGLDRLDADMIWPDPTHGAVLSFTLVDPKGRLRQISYDYGTPSTRAGRLGTVPNLQHTEIAHPEAGKWTAKILWANGRSHLQDPPNVPGTYTGSVSFKASGRHFVTAPASGPVVIPAHSSVGVPLHIAMPAEPGDHPQSVQFTADSGAATSLPVSRRTLIPAAGGPFDTLITSTVGRDQGQTSTFNFPVAAGRKDLTVTFQTDDAGTDNPYTFYLVDPSGKLSTSVGSAATTVDGVTKATGTLHVANPAAGMWEIDVKLNLTVSGKEFTQVVHGTVAPDASAAPVITSPGDGAISGGKTPAISGTGAPGATIKVTDETGRTVCTTTVTTDGSWTCTPNTDLAPGSHTLTANQTDGNGTTTSPTIGVTIAYSSTTENITTTVTQQGGLTISVDNAAAVTLPTPVLTGDATALTTSGDINPVTVTDTRTHSPGWNVVGQVADFTNTNGDTIAATNLGWTPKVLDTATGQTVTPGTTINPGTNGGLAKSQQLATAGVGTANGTAHIGATLNLLAPTTTKTGTYTATMTLTAI